MREVSFLSRPRATRVAGDALSAEVVAQDGAWGGRGPLRRRLTNLPGVCGPWLHRPLLYPPARGVRPPGCRSSRRPAPGAAAGLDQRLTARHARPAQAGRPPWRASGAGTGSCPPRTSRRTRESPEGWLRFPERMLPVGATALSSRASALRPRVTETSRRPHRSRSSEPPPMLVDHDSGKAARPVLGPLTRRDGLPVRRRRRSSRHAKSSGSGGRCRR